MTRLLCAAFIHVVVVVKWKCSARLFVAVLLSKETKRQKEKKANMKPPPNRNALDPTDPSAANLDLFPTDDDDENKTRSDVSNKKKENNRKRKAAREEQQLERQQETFKRVGKKGHSIENWTNKMAPDCELDKQKWRQIYS